MGLFFADHAEEVPGAIRQDDSMDFGVVLNGEQEIIESFVGRAPGERGKDLL